MKLINMLVVYYNPSDFPGKYVVREWRLVGMEMLASPMPLAVADTYEEAIAHIPSYMVCAPRKSEDDHCILETWF